MNGSVPNRVLTQGSLCMRYPPPGFPATGIYGGIDIRDAHNGQLAVPCRSGPCSIPTATFCMGKWLSERHHRHVRRQIVVLKDTNTLTLRTSSAAIGPQQLPLSAPDGEFVSLETAFLAQ